MGEAVYSKNKKNGSRKISKKSNTRFMFKIGAFNHEVAIHTIVKSNQDKM